MFSSFPDLCASLTMVVKVVMLSKAPSVPDRKAFWRGWREMQFSSRRVTILLKSRPSQGTPGHIVGGVTPGLRRGLPTFLQTLRNLVCGDGEQNAFRVEWAFGFEGPCINTGALTYSLSQSGLCGIDGATYITEGLILNEVGRNSFGVTLEERLHLRVLASDLLSSVLRFFPSTLLPGRWGLMTFRFAQELDEYADSSVNMFVTSFQTRYCRRPSHPPGVYGVHPLGPDPIPARLASHRDVVGMGCSDPRSPSASEKSHTPESAPVP
ncbi:hypothetical protein T01_6305 [Trichinella spiralis]|uniref:Uncharacterized protein n=1 Tax=Trichinella spiralis TaxID=6334 RepID=A0A0V1AS95_TRISP|nr:hypothetical protein T01_6305 [Trichinella spiralis]